MTRHLIMFYVTAADLRPLLSSLETQKNLQYTLTGLFDANTPQTYRSYVDIPDFGKALHPMEWPLIALCPRVFTIFSQGHSESALRGLARFS